MNSPVTEMIMHEICCVGSVKYTNDYDVITCRGRYANTNTIRKTAPSDIAEDLGVVFTNKLSVINKWGRTFSLSQPYQFVTKTTTDVHKKREYIHEAYIGQFVTNKLNDKIPNFAHVFGLNKDESVVVEYIPGMTLFEYINSPKFRFDEFKIILAQIALAVKMAHYKYGFVHNDLAPWNIILFQSFSCVTTEYEVGPNEKVSIRGKRIPVIIDFGKSTAVVDGVKHGIIESSKSSSIQDILTLILTSCKTILATRRSPEQFTETMRLFNFLSGNRYLPKPLQTSFEMKTFLKRHAKYEAMISDDKFELESKDAMDFVRYLGVSLNY
jgi:serine/threonine protein kinase